MAREGLDGFSPVEQQGNCRSIAGMTDRQIIGSTEPEKPLMPCIWKPT